MSDKSAIEWTEATWNPTTGCDRVSAGCDNCYALTLAKRLKAMGSAKPLWMNCSRLLRRTESISGSACFAA